MGGARMDFGYFTLSDNHYDDNPRTANEFVADITAEALYAEELGMHSAWVGEHHFNSLGVLFLPAPLLSHLAPRPPPARRRRCRCCRCITRPASPSNGRRSISFPAAVSFLPPGAATTAAN